MSNNAILVDGDAVIFDPKFGAATITVPAAPVPLPGSSSLTLDGKKICIQGDEKKVVVPGCTYFTSQYSIPGAGKLEIAALHQNQCSRHLKDRGKAVLLKGVQFTAKFTVTAPASKPPSGTSPPKKDTTTSYTGKGRFVVADAQRLTCP